MYNLAHSRDFSRIDSLENLADALDIPGHILSRCANAPNYFYREIEIPKKSGGRRAISIPSPTMHAVHLRLKQFLFDDIAVSDHAHGYVHGRSIVTNASSHTRSSSFARFDIEDFFGSIKTSHVFSISRALGLGVGAARSVSLICTKDGSIPQGASTSPVISNIFMTEIDRRIAQYAKMKNYTYTRYVDDIVLSGKNIGLDLESAIEAIIRYSDLRLNKAKTLFALNVTNFKVTGISISDGSLFLPRKAKRDYRAAAHFLLKNGILSESRREGSFDPFYVDRIQGQLSFWLQIEPGNIFARRVKTQIKEMVRHFYEQNPTNDRKD